MNNRHKTNFVTNANHPILMECSLTVFYFAGLIFFDLFENALEKKVFSKSEKNPFHQIYSIFLCL